MSGKTISADELDRMFDDGENIDEYLDWENARRPGLEPEHVDLQLGHDMVRRLEQEADLRGITRQALIAQWIAERLDQAA